MREILKTVLLLMVTCSFSLCLHAQVPQDDEIAKLNSELLKAYNAGKYDEALGPATRVVELTSQRLGKDNIAVARALKNKGFIENAKADTKRAEKTLTSAMHIFEGQKDLSDADTLSFASLLEVLAKIKGNDSYDSGESYLERALHLREKAKADSSREAAYTLANLANFKYWSRDYKTSADLYKRALLILSKLPLSRAEIDNATVYARTQCSYRKAKIEDQFEPVRIEYAANILSHANSFPAPVSGGVVNGKAISIPKPGYPLKAMDQNTHGWVEVEVLIGEKGEVISACARPGKNIELVESSEAAALKAKFSPTTVSGRPVKVAGIITYKYDL